MIEQKLNDNWKFWVDKDSFSLVWDISPLAEQVTLPHDAMMTPAVAESRNGGNTGYRDGDSYTYVRLFFAPAEYENQTVILKFEGVYMNALVYVNGQLAGKSPFGYTTFYVRMNDFLRYGEENEIRVLVKNGAMKNSRWYSGGGIYRDVGLLVSGLVYLVPEGVRIRTESADEEYAVLAVDATFHNRYHAPAECILESQFFDAAGKPVARDRVPVTLLSGEMRTVTRRMAIERPALWSEEEPVLYTCVSRLEMDGVELDKSVEHFGIRTLQLDAGRGLRVNGKPVKLRGACIHHDSGLLGAATYDSVQYRQIRKLKEAGFNALRMSHHPMAPAMLRACDELGMYVMDEAFDMWNRCKSDYDYGLCFEEWWERDVTAMVRKDFNHPSVILYSVGNEIPEIGTAHGAKLCHDLCETIRKLDGSRYTLAAINGVFAAGDCVDQIVADVASGVNDKEGPEGNVNNFMTLMEGHMDEIVVHPAISDRIDRACVATDIAGYNYMAARYEPDGKRYPNRVIVGSETYPPDIARNWELVERLNHVIGDFTWTGWDYIGEAGVGVPGYQPGEGGFGAAFPCQLAYCGDLDLTGFRRPVSYYREVVFGLRMEPYIAVQDPKRYGEKLLKTPWVLSDAVSSWTWKGAEGKPVIVEVYAPGSEAELLINGVSVGKKPSGKTAGYRVLFETRYEPGEITAVAYGKGGKEIGRTMLKTAGKDRRIVLKAEPEMMNDFFYITAELCDEEGVLATDEDIRLSVTVEGGAQIAGIGSANPKPKYHYRGSVTETFNGRAQIILKKCGDEAVTLHVCADDGRNACLTLNGAG